MTNKEALSYGIKWLAKENARLCEAIKKSGVMLDQGYSREAVSEHLQSTLKE